MKKKFKSFQQIFKHHSKTRPWSRVYVHFSNSLVKQCFALKPFLNPHWFFSNILQKQWELIIEILDKLITILIKPPKTRVAAANSILDKNTWYIILTFDWILSVRGSKNIKAIFSYFIWNNVFNLKFQNKLVFQIIFLF